MAIHYVIHNDGKTWATTAIDKLSKGATLAVTMWGAIWSKWSLKSAQKGQFLSDNVWRDEIPRDMVFSLLLVRDQAQHLKVVSKVFCC